VNDNLPWKYCVGIPLQRLFSTFANGWPGVGLLIQRLITAAALVHYATIRLRETSHVASSAPHLIAAGAGVLLLVGLWTPLAGAVLTAAEIWIVLSGDCGFWMPLVLASMGASLAMIGPGAWSFDARLFGRKQIKTLSS